MQVEVERDNALGDMLGVVADPLEVVADAHRADDLAQIDRHRLPPRNGQDRLFLDLMLHCVDGRIGGDHPLRHVHVAFHQRVDGVGDLPFRESAHLSDLAGDILQIAVEGLDSVVYSGGHVGHGGHPKRPVM